MKAIVYHKYGSPDVLRMEDIQKPFPGDDEVLVKICAVSINSWDWDWLTGKPFEYRFLSVDCRDLIPRICHVILPIQYKGGTRQL